MGSPTSPPASGSESSNGGSDDQTSAEALLSLNGIDTGWLTAELNQRGIDGTITSIGATLVGTGQVGENVRCVLGWAGSEHTGSDPTGSEPKDSERPSSVVVKLASSNEASRAAAEATRTYIREVGFYRDIADSVAIRIPKVHHVSEDRDNNRFILVMEDIAPATAGNQLTGCNLEQAELGVMAAADLHGSTWGRPELAELEWIDQADEQGAADRVALFAMLYPGFVDRYRDLLGAEELAFGDWLAENFESWLGLRPETQCLVHGDFRLDNMLFGTGEGAPALTTVDWQTPSLGGALSDVAYFLSGSLSRAELRAEEPGLLDRYRNRLATHGIELSADQVLQQYRAAAPAGFVMAVIASQLVGQTERGDKMFMVMASGSATQAIDLETAALLD